MAAKQANSINESGASGLCNFDGTATFGTTAATQYNVLTGASANTVNNVAPSATSGVPLISQGASAQPIFGTAVVAGGGTGNTSQTAYSLVCGGTTTTGAFQAVADVATGSVLVSGGTGALPAFSATPTVTSITFGAGAALSNYQIGTFTPTITGSSSNPTVGYSIQVGRYEYIGNRCTVDWDVTISSISGGSGNIQTDGLPFTVKNVSNYKPTGGISISNITPSGTPVTESITLPNNGTVGNLITSRSNNTNVNEAISTLGSTASLKWTLSYEV